MNNIKELIEKAKDSDDFITTDREYYYCIGVICGRILATGKVGRMVQSFINPYLDAKNDGVIKRRLMRYKQRARMLGLENNWKGNMLNNILSYEPKETIDKSESASNWIIVGFLSPE